MSKNILISLVTITYNTLLQTLVYCFSYVNWYTHFYIDGSVYHLISCSKKGSTKLTPPPKKSNIGFSKVERNTGTLDQTWKVLKKGITKFAKIQKKI